MKYLLLLILVACGHKQPPLEQPPISSIENLEKNGRFFAVKPMPSVTGTLRISTHNKELYALKMTNHSDSFTSAIKALTWKAKENVIINSSLLRFKEIDLTNKLPNDPTFKVSVSFDDLPENLTLNLVDRNSHELIWKGQSGVNHNMSKYQIDSLLNGHSNLYISKSDSSWEQMLKWKEQYNNLFYFNGETLSVFYIARDMKLSEVFETLKVTDAVDIADRDLWSFEGSKEKWFYNEIGSNLSIMSLSKDEIRKQYLKTIKPQSMTLQRSNGSAANVLKVTNNIPGSQKMLLRLKKAVRINRTFVEWVEEGRISVGSMGKGSTYKITHRKVESEVKSNFSFDDLISNLKLTDNNQEQSAASQLKMLRSYVDDYGNQIWELAAEFNSEFGLSFQNLPQSTFVEIGIVSSSFGRKAETFVNQEAGWNFEVEAYLQP